MKIRNGFVSNSSSSSFIVFKSTVIPMQDKEEYIKKFFVDEIGYDIEDLQDDWFLYVKKEIFRKTKNMPGFELIYADAEYGSEETVTGLLQKLEIPFMELE